MGSCGVDYIQGSGTIVLREGNGGSRANGEIGYVAVGTGYGVVTGGFWVEALESGESIFRGYSRCEGTEMVVGSQ